jgi:hypothetical protein
MKIGYKIGITVVFLVVLATGIFWLKPNQELKMGIVIATVVSADSELLNDDMGMDNRYIPEADIIAIEPNEASKEPTLLTGDFFSARAPEVSYDGNTLVFSGQKSKEDTWQIYTMDLQSLKVSQVTHCPVNCTDPAWLPDGRIAFSRLNEEETYGQVHVLYACELNGENMKRLMFHPNSALSASVFQDGRILVLSEQKYPEKGKRHMLAFRIDGTKSELFFRSEQEAFPVSRVWEAPDGKMYFIEKDAKKQKTGSLVSVAKGHPMSSYENITGDIGGDFHSVYPDNTGEKLWISFRKDISNPFELHSFNLKSREVAESIYANDEFHIIEPVVRQERKNPLKLPTIVNESKTKGTLLCLNTDLSMIPVGDEENDEIKTSKVQVFGLEGMLGEISVEEDGSFYIEIEADKPVRFQTVNAKGEILRGPSSWVWVRPGEKRSCIGCHADPELAPDNKVPDALYAGMVSLPEGKRTEAIVLNGKIKGQNE